MKSVGTCHDKALGLGVGVAAGLSVLSLVERRMAHALARSVARVAPGREELWRPVGHAVALAGLGAGARFVAQRGLLRIEHKEESVEAAFDIAPPNPLVSGSFESHVSFDTLSKQGRRFGWTVTSEETLSGCGLLQLRRDAVREGERAQHEVVGGSQIARGSALASSHH